MLVHLGRLKTIRELWLPDGLDTERQQEAEAQVRARGSAQELPFPNFTAEYRRKTRNTLDYPPEGLPEASQ